MQQKIDARRADLGQLQPRRGGRTGGGRHPARRDGRPDRQHAARRRRALQQRRHRSRHRPSPCSPWPASTMDPSPHRPALPEGRARVRAASPAASWTRRSSPPAGPGHAMLLDCRDLSQASSSRSTRDDLRVVIVNSMVKHELTGGEYAERRRQCEEGVAFFRKAEPVRQGPARRDAGAGGSGPGRTDRRRLPPLPARRQRESPARPRPPTSSAGGTTTTSAS